MRALKHSWKHAAAFALGATLVSGGQAEADQVIPDDLIVQGSLCVGFDCVNNENFGFDTIRLKENNTRIKFEDTSSTASFPTNDWTIIANDSANGGASYLGFEDVTAARIPFRVTAGAPANSLFVDSTGRVGFRTSTPVLDLHVRTGNTPAHRLEQDSSSGFTAQTWDIAGNEANFFVRDVTGGSRLPFRIRPGAPTSSIDIAATGRVGIGTASPSAPLNVVTDAARIGIGNAAALLQNPTGAVAMQLLPASNTNTNFWNVAAATPDVFRISRSGTGANELTLTSAGNLTITGTLTTGGPTCGGGCDRVFDPDYDVPSISDHGQLMWANGYLPEIGPTPEGKPIDLTDKLGRMLNELEKAHIYIYEQHRRMDELHRRIERLESATAGKG